MISERRKAYLASNATKLVSLKHLRRLATNPALAYQHAKSWLTDRNFQELSTAQELTLYKESLETLAQLRPSANEPVSTAQWSGLGDESSTGELGELFKRYGSDKSTLHDYHKVYGSILAAKRGEVLNILEIGLGSNNLDVPSNMGVWGKPGASLRAFRDWAPNAEIFGADVDRRILFEEPRIITFWVDQTDKDSLASLAARLEGRKFDLIIDDGLHLPHANFQTIKALFPLLAKDGTFVIEDIDAIHLPFWRIAHQLLSGYRTTLIAAKGGFLFVVGP
jgi:hypothetical protein